MVMVSYSVAICSVSVFLHGSITYRKDHSRVMIEIARNQSSYTEVQNMNINDSFDF